MMAIVQINFTNDVSEEELAVRSGPEQAQVFTTLPGLLWKIWLRDPERRESGGIYLFESREAAEAYVAGPIVARIKGNPDFGDVTVKVFNVREEQSRITRAPLADMLAAVTAP
jgi:hypothetical protein